MLNLNAFTSFSSALSAPFIPLVKNYLPHLPFLDNKVFGTLAVNLDLSEMDVTGKDKLKELVAQLREMEQSLNNRWFWSLFQSSAEKEEIANLLQQYACLLKKSALLEQNIRQLTEACSSEKQNENYDSLACLRNLPLRDAIHLSLKNTYEALQHFSLKVNLQPLCSSQPSEVLDHLSSALSKLKYYLDNEVKEKLVNLRKQLEDELTILGEKNLKQGAETLEVKSLGIGNKVYNAHNAFDLEFPVIVMKHDGFYVSNHKIDDEEAIRIFEQSIKTLQSLKDKPCVSAEQARILPELLNEAEKVMTSIKHLLEQKLRLLKNPNSFTTFILECYRQEMIDQQCELGSSMVGIQHLFRLPEENWNVLAYA